MKERTRRGFLSGTALLAAFGLWTVLIRSIDVQAAGPNGSTVGFAAFNVWFHRITGVHMTVYTVTDWLGLIPVSICLCFGAVGTIQLIKRRSLRRVDADILLLGAYYVLVILGYLVFEMIPINCRPTLINGVLEASYPSSTTLLVLSVMPTLKFQIDRRSVNPSLKRVTSAFVILFSAFMVIGRTIAGVHWATDIVGSVLLSSGLYLLYRHAVVMIDQRRSGTRSEEYYGVS